MKKDKKLVSKLKKKEKKDVDKSKNCLKVFQNILFSLVFFSFKSQAKKKKVKAEAKKLKPEKNFLLKSSLKSFGFLIRGNLVKKSFPWILVLS